MNVWNILFTAFPLAPGKERKKSVGKPCMFCSCIISEESLYVPSFPPYSLLNSQQHLPTTYINWKKKHKMQHPEHSANIPPTWSTKTTLSDLPAEQHVPVQEAIDKEREPVRESVCTLTNRYSWFHTRLNVCLLILSFPSRLIAWYASQVPPVPWSFTFLDDTGST